ncbi:MAG: hypothetical protein ACREHV_17485, partial [Rhizomicrobium sp.]
MATAKDKLEGGTGTQPGVPDVRRFAEVPGGCRAFVVPGDGFAPLFACGDVAVVDTGNREPERWAFVLQRSEPPPKCSWIAARDRIVRLYQLDPDTRTFSAETLRDHPPPYWEMQVGRSSVGNWHPED